ncbi:DUF899 domain-containing protein [Luteolibacter luteus]|uniref:DUF899 domain-containing protein n=1 Tax=Luteolibacter luteus TaxID=2728835 RepID=A0A858RQ77_9BACT|nr:thioredoxin family protein [Luteolibacter luteus]QJE99042.1 DUF899 domain-containing protein [Luteolibacter luteus]
MSTNATLSGSRALGRNHQIVSEQEWIAARKLLLEKEKESFRVRDQLAEARRALPWVKVEKDYVFEGPQGKVKLADLFAGHSQLLVYHFMFGPDWKEGCPSCSFVSDHFAGSLPHLAARDVSLAVVSRAPFAKIAEFKKRMGWDFTWVSSYGGDFNGDYHVSFSDEQLAKGKVDYNYTLQEFPSAEAPGISVFYKDEDGSIYHTYSSYDRGVETVMSTYAILDLMPKGRDEGSFDFPMAWVRYHDAYETNEFADADKPYWPDAVGAPSSPSSSSSCGCK